MSAYVFCKNADSNPQIQFQTWCFALKKKKAGVIFFWKSRVGIQWQNCSGWIRGQHFELLTGKKMLCFDVNCESKWISKANSERRCVKAYRCSDLLRCICHLSSSLLDSHPLSFLSSLQLSLCLAFLLFFLFSSSCVKNKMTWMMQSKSNGLYLTKRLLM